VTNEQLCKQAQAGDERAFESLYGRMQRRGRGAIRGVWSPSMSEDDLLQEARLGLWDAVQSYDHAPGHRFAPFASMVMRRNVLEVITRGNRQMRQVQHMLAPNTVALVDGVTVDIWEILPGRELEPHDRLVCLEELRRQRDLLQDVTEVERVALLGIANDRPMVEIAAQLGRRPKAVDNAVQRARRKLAA